MYCASCEPDSVRSDSYPAQGEIEVRDMPQNKHAKFAWVSLSAELAACRCSNPESERARGDMCIRHFSWRMSRNLLVLPRRSI
jgi:hypothetical protein